VLVFVFSVFVHCLPEIEVTEGYTTVPQSMPYPQVISSQSLYKAEQRYRQYPESELEIGSVESRSEDCTVLDESDASEEKHGHKCVD
jgi:hypothetical protein